MQPLGRPRIHVPKRLLKKKVVEEMNILTGKGVGHRPGNPPDQLDYYPQLPTETSLFPIYLVQVQLLLQGLRHCLEENIERWAYILD